MRRRAGWLRLAVIVGLGCTSHIFFDAFDNLRAAARQGRLVAPSFECPEAKKRLPEGAAIAVAHHLGSEAQPLCLGDLNGNGRPEVLAVVSDGTRGEGLGYYWVTRKSGIFEADPDKHRPWKALLTTETRILNERGDIGWKEPVGADAGIGLRFTMTGPDGGICLQLRRLDSNHHRSETPLVLVRWDPTVERYEPGSCPGGTAGKMR